MSPKFRSFVQRGALAALLLLSCGYFFYASNQPATSLPPGMSDPTKLGNLGRTNAPPLPSQDPLTNKALADLKTIQDKAAKSNPKATVAPLTAEEVADTTGTPTADTIGPLPNAYTDFRLPMSYSEFLRRVNANQFRGATYSPSDRLVMATGTEGTTVYTTQLPPGDTTTIPLMVAHQVDVSVLPLDEGSAIPHLVGLLLPTLLLIAFFIWMQRRQSKAGGGMMDRTLGFGRSKAQQVKPGENRIRLKDVAGCDEAKHDVAEIVTFLKEPDQYFRVGAKAPRGVLMQGPPGTGKTLLAKAVAGEAGVPFFFTSGSDFVEMFVGVGASRVRSMFEEARRHAPSILFIDEIDAVGRARGGSAQGGNDEREQTLNALLVEMDGFAANSGVVVIAATNRADVLDEALRRPGRFDRLVHVNLPDVKGRAEILRVHAQKVPVSSDVNWTIIARGTPGFSGADLSNLINEAALLAARERSTLINHTHIEQARDRVMMGAERKGAMVNPREREIVAYHEAGHAIVAHYMPHADPVHKITIVPRGQALGLTMQLPAEDASYNHDKTRLLTDVTVLMGGRAAEDVALNVETVGASDDFKRATRVARMMVAHWGMSDLGPVVVDTDARYEGPQWSEGWKREVDDRVAAIPRQCYADAKALLTEHREALERVAQALLKDETLDAAAFEALVGKGVGGPGVIDGPRKPGEETYDEVLNDVLGTEASKA